MSASSGVEEAVFAFYRYDPSMGAAVLFTLLFIGTTGYHIFQMFKSRTWFFVPFVIGGIFEIIGYIGRAMSSKQTPNWTLGPYIVQTLFLLLAPALLAASVYMFLGRIILMLQAESHALLRRKWLTKIFVTGDVLSFLLQGAGGGIQSSGNLENMKTGEHIIVVGLFVQIFFFGFFILTASHFYWKIKKYPIPRSCTPDIPWSKHLHVLYLASFLIMVRSIFRLAEYLQGNNGYLLHHEIFLYVFDALLMLITMVVFNIVHPQEVGRLLRRPSDYELTRVPDAYATKPYEGSVASGWPVPFRSSA
ncbi:RTA1 domain-containing protein [Aspergillus foveolatus]|uniref:RTA1 domain-containing protein n=1 Tax=Aspergillus foveolatus TaxID=210207 RepID=UPI003CCDB90B